MSVRFLPLWNVSAGTACVEVAAATAKDAIRLVYERLDKPPVERGLRATKIDRMILVEGLETPFDS